MKKSLSILAVSFVAALGIGVAAPTPASAHTARVSCEGASNDFSTTMTVHYLDGDGVEIASMEVLRAPSSDRPVFERFTPPASTRSYFATWPDGFRQPRTGSTPLPRCTTPPTITIQPTTTSSIVVVTTAAPTTTTTVQATTSTTVAPTTTTAQQTTSTNPVTSVPRTTIPATTVPVTIRPVDCTTDPLPEGCHPVTTAPGSSVNTWVRRTLPTTPQPTGTAPGLPTSAVGSSTGLTRLPSTGATLRNIVIAASLALLVGLVLRRVRNAEPGN